MIDQFKQAKKNREILHFKNFQNVDFSWDTILNFLFEETKKENKQLESQINDIVKNNINNLTKQIKEEYKVYKSEKYMY